MACRKTLKWVNTDTCYLLIASK